MKVVILLGGLGTRLSEETDLKPINIALDCFTKSTIAKFDLLYELGERFGLQYEVSKDVNAT